MKQFGLLKHNRFLPIFCTQFLGALNDNVFKNAIVILIAFSLADKMGANGSILVIIAAGIFILPFFLFSATAGQLADKFEKSMLIRRVKIAEIVIMCLASVGFYLMSAPILLTVLFFMGTQSTLFGPLKYSILPQHLLEDELLGGNGMIQMGTYMAILLGTILGGVLISSDPNGSLYVSIVIVLLATAGWVSSRSIPEAIAPEPTLCINWNFITETCRIIKYAREDRTVFWAIIGISWFWFYGATFLSLVPSYTRDVLSADERIATLMLTAFSIGIGTGSLLCEKLSHKHINLGLVPIGAVGLTLFATDLSFISLPAIELSEGNTLLTASMFLDHFNHWRVLIDLSMIGLSGGLYMVPLYALVQQRSNPCHRSRIIAANNIINAFFMVISAILMIVLISVGIEIPEIFFIIAILNLVVMTMISMKESEFLNQFIKYIRY
ncbi:MAG: MFS family permease [Gammaproteobacteria bacterium]|jgi:MFS family permease